MHTTWRPRRGEEKQVEAGSEGGGAGESVSVRESVGGEEEED